MNTVQKFQICTMHGMMLEAANIVHLQLHLLAVLGLLGTSAFLLAMYIGVHFTV